VAHLRDVEEGPQQHALGVHAQHAEELAQAPGEGLRVFAWLFKFGTCVYVCVCVRGCLVLARVCMGGGRWRGP
jgi:hypothetical protein